MIFLKKNFGNILLVALLFFIISKQVPLWLHSNKQIGKNFSKIQAVSMKGERVLLPQKNQKTIYIFWATWCGPCHLQLSQFEKAITNGSLSSDRVVAISVDKSSEDIKAFVKEKAYSFKVFQAESGQSWADLNVQATPSIAFIDKNNKVADFFTGLSPLSVYKANRFLEQTVK